MSKQNFFLIANETEMARFHNFEPKLSLNNQVL